MTPFGWLVTPQRLDPATPAGMRALLSGWVACGWLRDVDGVFAGFLAEEAPDASPWLILAAALVSHQWGRGQVCLDLDAVLRDPAFVLALPPDGTDRSLTGNGPTPAELLTGLHLSSWLEALSHPGLVGGAADNTPLVLEQHRLYLRRFWVCEQQVIAGIRDRLARQASWPQKWPPERLRGVLDALFADTRGSEWQKMACALAARSGFAILTGGPGTGKTTTVVRLLIFLQLLVMRDGTGREDDVPRPLRICLAAPTGKAASRLNVAITQAMTRLLATLPEAEALRAVLPTEVVTLHRLLGVRADSRRFRHHADNPLALDLLVVDEASMIDLELLAALLQALPMQARLVLLGDKDQLASVEAGGVLGELCQRASAGHYTPESADWLHAVTGHALEACRIDPDGVALDQAVVMLRQTHRFAEDSGIGRLAEAVHAGDARTVRALWPVCGDLVCLRLQGEEEEPELARLMVEGSRNGVMPGRHGFRHYLEIMRRDRPLPGTGQEACDTWARTVLQAYGEFQVLCVLRRGERGVEGLNLRIARYLRAAGVIESGEGWYPGRPVLVTRNDYTLGLMNGMIGITLELPDGDGVRRLRVAFADGGTERGETIRWFLPGRLQAVETVYALTIHRSQGSEFTHAALVMPETLNPVLTRELIYTGITRARRWLTLIQGNREELFEQALQRRVVRPGGLLSGLVGMV